MADAGIHLTRTAERAAGIDALAALLGGRVGLDAVLSDLNRRGRRGLAPGRAVAHAITWDREDRRTPLWWPQGITTSADASVSEDVAGRRLVVVTWYAPTVADGVGQHGSRVTFLDLATRRYRHVLLVVPELGDDGRLGLEPLRVHAGGLVWCGPWLHVAATGRGFFTCHVDDLLRVPDDLAGDPDRLGIEEGRVSSFGYRYLLPVRFGYKAHAGPDDVGLRYSFLSLDRGTSSPELVVGEYARHDQTRRLARFQLERESLLLSEDEEGRSRPLLLADGGVLRTQGAAVADGTYYLTVSQGRTTPGSVYVGRPGSFRRHRWAVPMGPEDIAYWPSTDRLWSITEHPGRRWVFAMERSWFDR